MSTWLFTRISIVLFITKSPIGSYGVITHRETQYFSYESQFQNWSFIETQFFSYNINTRDLARCRGKFATDLAYDFYNITSWSRFFMKSQAISLGKSRATHQICKLLWHTYFMPVQYAEDNTNTSWFSPFKNLASLVYLGQNGCCDPGVD